MSFRTGTPKTRWRGKPATNRIARRNLIWSVAAEHVGFSIWSIWSVMVLFMPASVYGFSAGDKFLLGATATLVGACLRFPYTFATARFGGRNWTMFSALVLLIPTIGTMLLLANPGLPLWPYLVCAALAGLGGGNFASSMTNINAFYPQRLKGCGTGAQRRRRQPRSADGPAGRPAGDRNRRQPAALLGVRGIPCAAGDRGDRCGAVHGQPAALPHRDEHHARGAVRAAHLGDRAALHRHLRIIHRVLVRLWPGAADELHRRRSKYGAGVAACRPDRLPGTTIGVAVTGIRRQARRPHRRRPGHPRRLLFDDPGRRNPGQ